MRGVVTLAAVFPLPEETPQREVLRLAAFTVVAGTLLVQGTTLPWLVRRLGLPPEVIAQLRERAERRSNMARERLGRSHDELEPPSTAYRRLRTQMLRAERETIIAARDAGTVDDAVLRAAMTAIDLEESLLDRAEDAQARVGDELTVPRHRSGDCEHLCAAPRVASPAPPTVARSACATARAGCTCACAWPAGTWVAATRPSAVTPTATSATPAIR